VVDDVHFISESLKSEIAELQSQNNQSASVLELDAGSTIPLTSSADVQNSGVDGMVQNIEILGGEIEKIGEQVVASAFSLFSKFMSSATGDENLQVSPASEVLLAPMQSSDQTPIVPIEPQSKNIPVPITQSESPIDLSSSLASCSLILQKKVKTLFEAAAFADPPTSSQFLPFSEKFFLNIDNQKNNTIINGDNISSILGVWEACSRESCALLVQRQPSLENARKDLVPRVLSEDEFYCRVCFGVFLLLHEERKRQDLVDRYKNKEKSVSLSSPSAFNETSKASSTD